MHNNIHQPDFRFQSPEDGLQAAHKSTGLILVRHVDLQSLNDFTAVQPRDWHAHQMKQPKVVLEFGLAFIR